jgi:hypothetical protein
LKISNIKKSPDNLKFRTLPVITEYFGQNKSSRAQILAGFLVLNGKSEKVGLLKICCTSSDNRWRG